MLVYLLFVLYIFIYFKKLLLAPAPKEEGEGGGESTHDDVKNKSNKEVRSKYVAFMVWAVKILVCFVFRSSDSVTKKDCGFFPRCAALTTFRTLRSLRASFKGGTTGWPRWGRHWIW